jgi:hypothetical protein
MCNIAIIRPSLEATLENIVVPHVHDENKCVKMRALFEGNKARSLSVVSYMLCVVIAS